MHVCVFEMQSKCMRYTKPKLNFITIDGYIPIAVVSKHNFDNI